MFALCFFAARPKDPSPWLWDFIGYSRSFVRGQIDIPGYGSSETTMAAPSAFSEFGRRKALLAFAGTVDMDVSLDMGSAILR